MDRQSNVSLRVEDLPYLIQLDLAMAEAARGVRSEEKALGPELERRQREAPALVSALVGLPQELALEHVSRSRGKLYSVYVVEGLTAQSGRTAPMNAAEALRQRVGGVLDVTLINGFAPLMRQAIGEAVTLDLALSNEQLCAHVDPTQLETALLNLAVNARDAMPEGGVLSIAAEREGSGDDERIVISVHDTGHGMAPDVVERVFEPFFTTKEVGKGSGLGLSQVYGFVRQSEGEVRLESVVGRGTTFHLRLPKMSGPKPGKARWAAGLSAFCWWKTIPPSWR